MAIAKCKGTLIQVEVASTLTTIAQLVELTLPKDKSTDFEAETLDQAGVGMPREMTGSTDTDPFGATLFWDPALASQAIIRTSIATPVKTIWAIILVDVGATQYDFTAAGLEFGGVVAGKDGLKAELSGNVDGLPVIT